MEAKQMVATETVEVVAGAPGVGETELRQAMELLFYAYRDFTAEPDAILADYGFGRAHHRVIYFVHCNPGISVNQLLGILKITKQSLSRVLSQLIREGFVEQTTDHEDRRRRILALTDQGRELEGRLTARQGARIAHAYSGIGPEGIMNFKAVLLGLINEGDRARFSPQDVASPVSI